MSRVLLTLTAIAAVLIGMPRDASADQFAGPLVAHGHSLRDQRGRTVILHGLFAVWKQSPLYPSSQDDSANPATPSFTESDADQVAALGADSVRLAWYWEGLEPTQGQYDSAYEDGIAAVIDKLDQRGIFTVLDSHQDQYDEIFGNKPGFPTWSAVYDGLPTAPDPSDPGYAGWKFPLGYFHESTQRAFGNLYANAPVDGDLIRSSYASAWQEMASRFHRDPMLAGYDVSNEPFPGSTASSPAPTDCATSSGCADYDRETLEPFETALARSIRAADPSRTIFFEPTIFFNTGSANGFGPPPRSIAPVGLSFHNQCPTRAQYSVSHDPALIEQGHTVCPPIERTVMSHADATAARLGGPPLMTEVAGTSDADVQELNCLLERADAFQTGFTYGLSWSNPNKELRRLAEESEPTGAAPFKEQAIARVYPRAVAGTLRHFRFNVRTARFHLSYTPRRSAQGRTQIEVPKEIQYPQGYRVTVSGGRVRSPLGADLVRIANSPGAKRVSVMIEPRPGDSTVRPDFPPCTDLDPGG